MRDVFEINNWISAEDLQSLSSIIQGWDKKDFIPNYGKFPNQLIAKQAWHLWNDHDQLGNLLKSKITETLGECKVVEVDYVELFLPWDIHNESVRTLKGSSHWYTLIIPLEDYYSRTIIFDQQLNDSNDFYKYKNVNSTTTHPVDLDFWNANLTHCHNEDRLYLSLKYVSQNWRAGDILCFKRTLFHASDNFHERGVGPKKFLQIITDLE